MIRVALTNLILFVLAATAFGADWVPLIPGARPDTSPTVVTLSSNVNSTVLEVTVPGFWAETTQYGMKLRLPGRIVSTEFGRPELPMVGCTVAMPHATRPWLLLRTARTVRPGGFKVRMAPKLELDGHIHVPPVPAAPNRPYPEAFAAVTHTGLWRDVPLATLQIHPFQASGDGTVISIAVRMVVEVCHPAQSSRWPTSAVPADLRPLLESLAVNGTVVPTCAPQVDGVSTEYLVIAHQDLAAAVQPLLEWRTRQGFVTELVKITSTSPAQVKKEILARYDNGQGKLKFVLLVGDYGRLPWYVWNGNPSDSWYACLTGSTITDLYPDVGLGRLSGMNPGEITQQVTKIMAYEQNPPSGSWFDRIILAAHEEGGTNGRFVSCCESIATGPLSTSGWSTTKQYGYIGGVSNTTLTSHINSGAGIVFYRGHGDTTEWSGWCRTTPSSFTTADVAGLANGGKTPVVFSVCCTTGNFRYGTCFTEQWLRAQQGAVACLGATSVSYTTGNTPMAIEFCRAIFQDKTTNIYGFHAKGIAKALAVGGMGGQMAAYLFCWMGDSCTNLWLRDPDTLTVTHPSSISPGQQNVQVKVMNGRAYVNGAKVCLYKGNDVFAVAYTQFPPGIARFTVNPETTGPLLVTVTVKDCRPYQGQIDVKCLNGGYTIDPNGSGPRNYTTLSAALSDLAQQGLCSPVTYTLASTTYREVLILPRVAGASNTNTITFRATGAPAVIDAGGAQDAVTLQDGCAYYRFENLKIQGCKRYGIFLDGSSNSPMGCHHNTFLNVDVDLPATTIDLTRALQVNHSWNNHFDQCRFKGAWALHVDHSRSNRLEQCRFRSGCHVIYTYAMAKTVFDRCTMDGMNTAYELLVSEAEENGDNVYQNCFFHDTGSTHFGIFMGHDGLGNMFWHNTIIVKTSAPAVFMGGDDTWPHASSWRNNIIVNLGTGPAVQYGEISSTVLTLEAFDADHNCYYAPNSTSGTIRTELGTFKGSLKDWKNRLNKLPRPWLPSGGNHYDQNSVEGDPGLFTVHLKTDSPCINRGTATYVAGPWITFDPQASVSIDLDGDTRPVLGIPDIGADEYNYHLLAVGHYLPGGFIQVQVTGPVGAPVLWAFTLDLPLRDPPLPVHGAGNPLWLADPLHIVPHGTIPAGGRLLFGLTIPATIPTPFVFNHQALVGPWLTNVDQVVVEKPE